MLDVNDPNHLVGRRGDNGNGQKRFVLVFGQRMKKLKPAVLTCVPRDRDRLNFPGNPAGNSLAHLHSDLADQPGMRIFRGAQDKILAALIQEIYQACVAARNVNNKTYNLPQYLIQIESRTYRLADLVQDPKLLPR